MKVTVPEAAALLGATEERIYQWIEERDLPAYRINEQFRINPSELLEWATAHNVPVAPALFRGETDEECVPQISKCLQNGAIHYIEGRTKVEALREVVKVLPLDDDHEREMLLHVLLARESLGFATLRGGIAIPQVRSPIVLATNEPKLILCFTKEPADFRAADEKPVHAIFLLISPTIRLHLQVLTKLTYLLRDARFRHRIESRAPVDEIIRAARAVEEDL